MSPKFSFKHHVFDAELPHAFYAQTALVDLDNDGRLEYIVGQNSADIFWYKYHAPGKWSRHLLGEDSPSDVGGCAFDVDGDGYIDFVAGGAWYRNSRDPDKVWERFVFDAKLSAAHDVVAADLDGSGKLDVITMSDRNNLRWYKIPADPTQPWIRHDIGAPVHAGASVGDVNGNGHLDVLRTNVWFENVKGDGTKWIENPIAPNTPPPPDFQPYFAFDATYSVVCDMNGNGKNDIVFTDAEIPGGTLWWMENVHGNGMAWRRHEIAGGFTEVDGQKARRGAYHSLYVGDLDGDGDLDVSPVRWKALGGSDPHATTSGRIWTARAGRGRST